MVETPKPIETQREESNPPPKVIEARTLLEGGREVWIVHDGTRYRLRLTRRNKLILQK